MKHNATWIWQPDQAHTQSQGIEQNSAPILLAQQG